MIDLVRKHDMTRLLAPQQRSHRLLLILAAALTVGVLTAGPAAATGSTGSTTTVNAAIKSGAEGTKVGDATFTRTRSAHGQTLTIRLSVPGGISQSHVCISDHAFTSRIPPGQCPYSQGETGSAATYTIDLGSRTGTVYVQAHVITKGETAYAGWERGSGGPFYGNVAVADPSGDGTPVPVGAVGALALSGLLMGGLVLRGALR